MQLAPDFDEFIGSLIAHGVEFLVVGAYALAFHGAPRFTGDLDILVRPTLDNAARLLRALAAFGFPATGLSPEAISDRRRMLQMGVPPVQINVMSAISGVEWGPPCCAGQVVGGVERSAGKQTQGPREFLASAFRRTCRVIYPGNSGERPRDPSRRVDSHSAGLWRK
jgi:hypothetical protein